MRVVSGDLKGRKIFTPKGKTIRPTKDMVREAIFSSIGEIKNIEVLDLFAGSGSLSIEALSRGAAHSLLIDNRNLAKNAILKNSKDLELEQNISFKNIDVFSEIDQVNGKFDIIFADPPYKTSIDTIEMLINDIKGLSLLKNNGIMVFEISSKMKLKNINVIKNKKYGNTRIYFIKL